MTRIVVSHRVEDEPYGAAAIVDGLATRFGPEDVGYASADLPQGEEMAQLLRYDVRAARVMVAVIGPRWLDARDPATGEPRLRRSDDWVRAQLAEAFQSGTQVIPVLLRQTPMPATRELPADISVLTWRHALRVTPGLPDSLTELVRVIGMVLDQPSVPRSRLWPSRPIREPHERHHWRRR